MTTIADLNDKWASYAGPGGWNGKGDDCILKILFRWITTIDLILNYNSVQIRICWR